RYGISWNNVARRTRALSPNHYLTRDRISMRHRKAGRIDIAERGVGHIAVAIQALRSRAPVNERAGTHEPPNSRIVNAPIHVDEVQIVQLLMPSKTLPRCIGNGRHIRS